MSTDTSFPPSETIRRLNLNSPLFALLGRENATAELTFGPTYICFSYNFVFTVKYLVKQRIENQF